MGILCQLPEGRRSVTEPNPSIEEHPPASYAGFRPPFLSHVEHLQKAMSHRSCRRQYVTQCSPLQNFAARQALET